MLLFFYAFLFEGKPKWHTRSAHAEGSPIQFERWTLPQNWKWTRTLVYCFNHIQFWRSETRQRFRSMKRIAESLDDIRYSHNPNFYDAEFVNIRRHRERFKRAVGA